MATAPMGAVITITSTASTNTFKTQHKHSVKQKEKQKKSTKLHLQKVATWMVVHPVHIFCAVKSS
jgi:hypothetical protein